MKIKILLLIDAAVNLALGILLLLSIFWADIITPILGVPSIENPFYPSILGGVFVGIGFALLIQSARHDDDQHTGLGLAGAAAINLCGAIVLSGWLIFLPGLFQPHGRIFLWIIVCFLSIISFFEIFHKRKN
jgi:hypothetical protein